MSRARRLPNLLGHLGPTSAQLVAGGVIGAFVLALLAVLRFGLPIWSMLFVVAAVAYLFFVLLRPTIGLLVVVCVFFVPIRLVSGVSLLQLVGASTAGLLLIWFLYNQRTIRLGNILIPLLLLGVLIVTSLWFSRDPSRTIFYMRRWVFNILFVLLMLNLITNFDIFKKVLWTVMIMTAVNSIAGILDFATSTEARYRSMGLMENENSFGHLAALAFPLALYQYLYQRGAKRWLGLGLCALFAGGVIVSVSRGAFLSLLIVSAAVMVLERRRRLSLLLIGVLALAAVPFLPQYFNERVGDLFTDVKKSVAVGEERGLTSRGYLNSAGVRIWLAHPIVGVGVGNFGHYYMKKESEPGMAGTDRIVAHNIYVQALAEMGTAGALVLLWLIVASTRSVLRTRRASRGDPDRWSYFGAIQMMALAIAVSTATYGSLMSNDFWMFLGLTAVASRIACQQPEADRSLAARGA